MDPQPETPEDDVATAQGSADELERVAAAEPVAEPDEVAATDAVEGGSADQPSEVGATDTALETSAESSVASTEPDAHGPDPAEQDAAEPDAEPSTLPDDDSATVDPADTLSPAVRRLVRQYDLDITGIHGTGPSGRLRVGDVIGMIGGRADAPAGRPAGAGRPVTMDEASETEQPATVDDVETTDQQPAQRHEAPTSSVFECDLSRVLAHRKRAKESGTDLLLTSYYLVACGVALGTVPEVYCGKSVTNRVLRVELAASTGDTHAVAVDVSTEGTEASLDERLNEVDDRLRSGDETRAAGLVIHHYGPSGSLLAMPTPIARGLNASVGIGAVQRRIVVRVTNGDEAPRVAALVYVSVSFHPSSLTLDRANRFLAELVRVLEQWPAPAT